jgi:hypothetical protein
MNFIMEKRIKKGIALNKSKTGKELLKHMNKRFRQLVFLIIAASIVAFVIIKYL